ncbi:MAG: ATP-binding protein [Candidatus Binatia bacterium]
MRPSLRVPFACRTALATSAAGWPAAGYGALAIYVAGDFDRTGSAWIFGAPFLLLLLGATVVHQLTMGLGAALGIPALYPGVRAVNRVLDPHGRLLPCTPEDLAPAVRGIVRLPLRNVVHAGVLSLGVVLGTELLEWWAAGTTSPNFGVIARSGLVASGLYMSVSLTLGELLVRPACRALRRAALQRAVGAADPFVLAREWRVLAAVVPPVAALAVAVEIGRSQHATALAYALLIGLSAVVAVGLAWLQHESHERAAREVAVACRALAAGEDGHLVTGSTEPALLGMTHEFNAAARRVGADRRASVERYRALFDGAGDAILLVDPDSDRVVEASARAERLFAIPRSDLVGRALADCVDAGTAQRLRECALAERAHAEVSLVNASIVRTDGSTVPVDASLTVVSAGDERVLQAILRDVRDRQRIEHELRRVARRFEELYRLAVTLGDDPGALAEHTVKALRVLLEYPIASVARIDGSEAVVLAVSAGNGVTVDGRRPLAGTPCAEVCAQAAPCVFSDVRDRFPTDRDLATAKMRTYCGVPILAPSGDVVGVVSVLDTHVRTVRDEDLQLLTSFAQRIAQALERQRLARAQEAFTRSLLESDRVKTEFLGMMSHELRTPLNIVLGYARMLLENLGDGDVMTGPERAEVLQRILAGGLHLSELVEDTLSVLRLEAGVVPVDAGPVTLSAFFDELQGVDRLLRRPSDVVERWRVDPDVPTLVTDRRKLRQVVTNLVGNARKFTDRGVIEVGATRDPATGGAVLTVRDTGCGIDAAHLPHVFDLYRQAPSGRRQDGCGLGLYIVRRYVELLGGRVSCTSTVGQGTTFVVTLPATAIAPAAAAAA